MHFDDYDIEKLAVNVKQDSSKDQSSFLHKLELIEKTVEEGSKNDGSIGIEEALQLQASKDSIHEATNQDISLIQADDF